MHGGPGTGQTHANKIIKVLKRNIGVNVHIVALQVVMADLLSRDTSHHSLNLPIFGQNGPKPSGDKSESNTMKAMFQFRWLVIDETIMVIAR